MQWLKLVWSTTWGKIVIASATVIIFISGGIAVDYGQLSYILFPHGPTSPTAQNVIVFVGGMNTSNSSDKSLICTVSTFDELAKLLVQDLQVIDPYMGHCPATTSMKNSPVNFAYFSYMGGSLNPNTGVWDPAPYNGCDPDTIPLKQDVSTFVKMLQAYRSFYPNAHFTIVSHSLGGLVALEGASAFVAQFGPGIINKLITVDSPLHGIVPSYPNINCEFIGGPILRDLNAVYNTPQLSEALVLQLKDKGTDVYTLGNNNDCVYQNLIKCKIFGKAINSIQTQFVSEAYTHAYTLPNDGGPEAGHGDIFSPNASNTLNDLVRYILAPHVDITQPKPSTVIWSNSTGTPLSFAATVRCDWGTANQATAILDIEGNTPYFAGTGIQTSEANVLSLQGVVNLPSDTDGPKATFYIKAGANACQYPKNTSPSVLPDNSDYSGGESTGIPLSLDGGKVAVGINGLIRTATIASGRIFNQELNYTNYNQNNSGSSIQSVSWSHDGTRLTYLIQTSITQSDTTATTADLYVTSSSFANPIKLATNIPNAIALTWNSTNDKIAILEETEAHNGPGPIGFVFTPSIEIVNAQNGSVVQQINLPASNSTFSPECGENCTGPRGRIQWGTNGTFLLNYGNVGTTFVTPSGQVHEFATVQNIGPNGASLGAMNSPGTLIAYPAINNGQVDVNLYSVNASGNLGTPTTLISMAEQSNFGDNPTVDLSPDSTQIGVCDNQLIGIVNIHHPGVIQKIAMLPSGTQQTQVNCEDLRWSPDGQSLVAQIAGYNVGASGLIVLPLNSSSPSILFGCNLSYSAGFQFDSNGGGNCYSGPSTFSLQPVAHEQNSVSVQTSSNTDNAKLLAQGISTSLSTGSTQSASLTINAGQSFTAYFDFENTGSTTWSDNEGYALACDHFYMAQAVCMNGTAQGLNSTTVPPGTQATFYLTLTAPEKPGTYQTSWDMHNSKGIFGQNHVFITVKVSAASLETVDWANFTYTTSNCYSNGPQQFTTHNGTATTSQGVYFGVEKPVFGDLTGDGQPEAVILYSCTAADSIGPFAQVFTGNAANPILIGDLPLQNNGLFGSISSASIVNGNLQLTGRGYAGSDPTCCPSLQVTTVYHWNGSQFVVISTNSTPAS